MIVDGLTHILPRYFVDKRDDALKVDGTFGELFASPKARIVQADTLLAEMDRSGVDRSVIAGFGWTDLELARRSNDYNLEAAARHPDRLIPVCSVNPKWSGDAATEEADRCLRAGAYGIGELHADTQGWRDPPYDALHDLMATIRAENAVVIVHGSEPIGHSYRGKGEMTPDLLIRLISQFPDNRFVFSPFRRWVAVLRPDAGSSRSSQERLVRLRGVTVSLRSKRPIASPSKPLGHPALFSLATSRC